MFWGEEVKPKVYLETTIVSYLTARPSRDPILAANLKQTKEWEEHESRKFELLVSDLVIAEASDGDPDAVVRRLAGVKDMPMLLTDERARALAKFIGDSMVLPAKAAQDALHVAIAAVNGADYLLTWNCRHLNNAHFKPRLEALCLAKGYKCPVICTPAELMED